MIRVLQFANVVNHNDFIHTIVKYANPSEYEVGVCVRNSHCNIKTPEYSEETSQWVLGHQSRKALPLAVLSLAKLLRQWKPDILHTHHYDQAIIGWLATRLCPHTRLVIGRHYSTSVYMLAKGLKQKLYLAGEQKVHTAAERVIVPSQLIFNLLTEKQGVDPEKVKIVHYGFDEKKYQISSKEENAELRRELNMEDRFVVSNLSQLNNAKGISYLIKATVELRKKHPEVLVLVAGEGPDRGLFEKEIKDAQLEEHFRLLGFRSDAMELLAASDAVVQPTFAEAFSQVMCEAMWMGKPLVMTEVSGAVDVIEHGVNGFLVPIKDSNAIVDSVSRLIEDKLLRENMGAKAKQHMHDNFRIQDVILKYEKVYKDMMSR